MLHKIYFLLVLACVLAFATCRKKEAVPAPVHEYTASTNPSYQVKALPPGCLGWVHNDVLNEPVYLCKRMTLFHTKAGLCTIIRTEFPLLIMYRNIQSMYLPFTEVIKMPYDKLCVIISKDTPKSTALTLEIKVKKLVVE